MRGAVGNGIWRVCKSAGVKICSSFTKSAIDAVRDMKKGLHKNEFSEASWPAEYIETTCSWIIYCGED